MNGAEPGIATHDPGRANAAICVGCWKSPTMQTPTLDFNAILQRARIALQFYAAQTALV